MWLAQLSPSFQSLHLLPTGKLCLSGADSQVGGLAYILEPHGPFQWTLLWDWEFLPLLKPPQLFLIKGLQLYFPLLESWVVQSVWLPSCSSQFICIYTWSASCRLPVSHLCPTVSTPPTSLDECFFFNSLVFGLLYRLIFWQFWLFFLLKFVVVLVLVVRGSTVCLTTSPSWLEVIIYNLNLNISPKIQCAWVWYYCVTELHNYDFVVKILS